MGDAFSKYYTEFSLSDGSQRPARNHFRNWWDGPRIREYRNTHFAGVEGSHATPTEVALTYHFYPEKVDNTPLNPEVAPWGRFYDSADYRKKFPDGRIGSNPALATAEVGKKIYESAIKDFAEALQSL